MSFKRLGIKNECKNSPNETSLGIQEMLNGMYIPEGSRYHCADLSEKPWFGHAFHASEHSQVLDVLQVWCDVLYGLPSLQQTVESRSETHV